MASTLMKPRLLFISPILPSPAGPGLAMRPYFQILNLSRIYSIHLLIAGSSHESPVDNDDMKKYCDSIDYICRFRYSGWKFSLWHRLCRFADRLKHFMTGGERSFVVDFGDRGYLQDNKTLGNLANMTFDKVHTFRFYLTPIVEILKKRGLRSFYSLDIDDIESVARRSIGDLYSGNGDFVQASRQREEAVILFDLESAAIPRYDQIFTCSRRDRTVLQERFPGKDISLLPNVVPVQKRAEKHRVNQGFTMLFVGTLGYYPNTDALLFFADQIAPMLRKKSPQRWLLRIVGALPEKSWMKRFEYCPEIKFAGRVKNLSCEYDAADIVVVPIRGGGGTRLKTLEAFAYRAPVVSTSMGADGLDVENGVHILIEDDPELFAEACIRLMTDHALGEDMSRRAFSLVTSKYSPDILNRAWLGQLPAAPLNC
jgi:polysaccharide biosynthesis protein PslH